jgi:hypothetical protein
LLLYLLVASPERHGRRQAFGAASQGLESPFRRWIARQTLTEEECFRLPMPVAQPSAQRDIGMERSSGFVHFGCQCGRSPVCSDVCLCSALAFLFACPLDRKRKGSSQWERDRLALTHCGGEDKLVPDIMSLNQVFSNRKAKLLKCVVHAVANLEWRVCRSKRGDANALATRLANACCFFLDHASTCKL